jgi:2-methylisocitrate lyase-like PEP mutase family enzyme
LRKAIVIGADVAFLEGMTTLEQCEDVCSALSPTPVLLNMVAGGVTPDLGVAEASRLGFGIIIFPAVALAPVYETVTRAMRGLKRTQRAEVSDLQKAAGVKILFNVCGMQELLDFDSKAGGQAFANGV